MVSDHDPSRFVVPDLLPAYLDPAVRASMGARVRRAMAELRECRACPRDCGVNRLDGALGQCATGRYARISSAFAHFGEEAPLRGWNGSGTIFICMCNLRCVFCQNWTISHRAAGEELTAAQLARLMLRLQERGCHNINLVTPEHVVPQVVEALAAAIGAGLHLPIVYNTSGYDSLRSLELLDGLIDIYMPDFKFWSPRTAARLCKAPDYPARAREAIVEMHRQVGELKVSARGIALRGVLVRHLVMPGQIDESRAIFRFLAEEVSPDTYVNIMGQYRPEHHIGKPGRTGARYAEIDRMPGRGELHRAYQAAREAGLWRFDVAA